MPRRRNQAEFMTKVLVIRNVSYETEGMLEALLRDEGLTLDILDFQQDPSAEPRLDGYAGLVVMGGPMGANDTDRFPYLLQVERLCSEAMEASVPLVGVCLGAQIMAKVLGSEVYPNPVREVGWYDLTTADGARGDPLFSELEPLEVVLQWHGDTFDLPKDAVLLASSPDCVNQAFRYGENGYAVQFHLEILESMIREWVRRDAARGWLGEEGRISAPRILADTDIYMSRSEELGRRVYRRFARMIAA
jgi:GMP synthase-like glutamine amidotransferase